MIGFAITCSCGAVLRPDVAQACPGCGRFANLSGLTPAARYDQVREMLNPPDGSEPLISREQAVRLLDEPASPPSRPVRVGDRIADRGGNEIKLASILPSDPYPFHMGNKGRYSERLMGELRHASDGAPIDVAASLAIDQGTQKTPIASMDGRPTEAGSRSTFDSVPLSIHEPIRAELADARKRIADLEEVLTRRIASGERDYAEAVDANARANRLGDANGELKTQNTELLAENATLRRELERLDRKAKAKR